jgi:6-phosphogluconolactonase
MIRVFSTSEALADAVARHVAECAEESIAATGLFILALSGGSTPEAAYRQLTTDDHPAHEGRAHLTPDDWRLTHIFWGDERCVPPDDPRSNYRMAKEALLDRVPIPAEHIHRIRGEDDPETAASNYERELRGLLPDGEIDLVLLGLGEDGHTASLFLGDPAIHEQTRWVVAVPGNSRSPLTSHLLPGIWRVTLTPGILNRAKNVTFVVSGANKAETLQRVLEQPLNPDALPAQAIRPAQGRVTWMVDQAAAGRVKPLATRDS